MESGNLESQRKLALCPIHPETRLCSNESLTSRQRLPYDCVWRQFFANVLKLAPAHLAIFAEVGWWEGDALGFG